METHCRPIVWIRFYYIFFAGKTNAKKFGFFPQFSVDVHLWKLSNFVYSPSSAMASGARIFDVIIHRQGPLVYIYIQKPRAHTNVDDFVNCFRFSWSIQMYVLLLLLLFVNEKEIESDLVDFWVKLAYCDNQCPHAYNINIVGNYRFHANVTLNKSQIADDG